MRLKLHPDGYVRVNEGESTVYLDTRENFELDFGQALPALPEGMVMLTYDSDTKVLTYTDAKGNASPVEGKANFAFGELVAGTLEDLAEKYQARQPAAEAPAPAEDAPEEDGPREEVFPVPKQQTVF